MNQTDQKKPGLLLQKIYTKDVSLETPMGIKAFKQDWKPKLEQELHTSHNKLEDDLHEVVLTITITATLAANQNDDGKDTQEEKPEETAFIIEVHQAGIFKVNTSDDSIMPKVINAACPNILFPYLREAVDCLAIKAGFPAVRIPPVNFEMLYRQALEQQNTPEQAH